MTDEDDFECEPDDSVRRMERAVDLLACETVGHKVRHHEKRNTDRPGVLIYDSQKPEDWVWRWETCDRCGAHLSGEIPEGDMDRVVKQMNAAAMTAIFSKPTRFWDGVAGMREVIDEGYFQVKP